MRNREAEPQEQEISVSHLISILRDSVNRNQSVIQELEEADARSDLKVKCWIDKNGVPGYTIKKKGLIGFRR